MDDAIRQMTKAQLKEEERALKEIKKMYEKARKDVEAQISALNARKDMQNLQSIIYQKKYQEAILKQIDGVLDELNNGQFETTQDFLNSSYSNGYIGMMYDLQKTTGCTVVMPIDTKQVIRAIKTDSKLSERYYQNRELPENLSVLKRNIRQQITRGIASEKTWTEVAYQIAQGMNSPFNKAMSDAMRIVRTEGHRVNQEGFLDAGTEAKNKGADIVKQWDATLDRKTRPWHQEADGQIREWNEYFIVGGEKMKAPSVGGSARNVCNCRCQLLQRAKWALDEAELKTLQDRASFFGLDKEQSFEDFKQKYLQLPKNADTMKLKDALSVPVKSTDAHYDALLSKLSEMKVAYNPVRNHTKQLSDEEIIKILAGGDNTSGSCASVGLAYIGQKQGWDVLDFRGSKSREFFSLKVNLFNLSKANGMKALKADGKCSLTVGNRLLKKVETGKEYYLCVGQHASIVRKTEDGTLQYLELQSAYNSGWTDFNGNPKNTLHDRFGCTSISDYGTSSTYDFMLDLEDSDFSTDDFKSLLGYINTSDSEQKKGKYGTIK